MRTAVSWVALCLAAHPLLAAPPGAAAAPGSNAPASAAAPGATPPASEAPPEPSAAPGSTSPASEAPPSAPASANAPDSTAPPATSAPSAPAPGDAPPPAPRGPATAPSGPVSRGTPQVDLPPIDLTEIPERCQTIAKRTITPKLRAALSARISLATCVAEIKFGDLDLIDGLDSVTALDEAAIPSFAMLEEVRAAATEPVTQVMATHAMAQLYSTMIMRMDATVTPAAPGATPEGRALRESRRDVVRELVVPWREKMYDVYAEIDELARTNPYLVRDPVALAAIRETREVLARPIANR